jgi:Xaa-Pro aminopeptidase
VRDRIEALQAWQAQQGHDVYAVTGAENAAYLSGWRPDVEPWERPIVMLVPRRGDATLVLHELSTHGVRMARERGTLVVDDVTFYVERPARRAPAPAATGAPSSPSARRARPAARRPRRLRRQAPLPRRGGGRGPRTALDGGPQPLVDARAVKAPGGAGPHARGRPP